jgi:DNA replication and repair protein RecF
MHLETIEADCFRNLSGVLDLDEKLTLVTGNNGQGKTNWLEAAYLLATSRSFRTARLQESICFDGATAIVRGRVRRSNDITHQLQAVLEGNTKAFAVNGKREPLHRYLRELNAVIFNSDELQVVRGSPENRRRFLDDAIVAIYPPYVQTLADLDRVLRQKNALLSEARDREYPLGKIAEMLQPWNEQFVQLASRVHKARLRYVDRLAEALEERLFGEERLSLQYVSSLAGKGDLTRYEELLAERLQLRVQAEVFAGHALIGPQRDDLEINADGRDLRKYGSAGQHRSALLALLLANISVYFAQNGEYPLFLLDDIDSELDYRRIGTLLEYLSDKTQAIVTSSKESLVERFGAGATVRTIEKGTPKSV